MNAESIEIKKRTLEELVEYLITKQALQKLSIEELQRAMGLKGYLSENPPISIQTHHSVMSELKRKMLTDFREFYGANKRYMGEWFDKKFEEFFTKMEAKYFK